MKHSLVVLGVLHTAYCCCSPEFRRATCARHVILSTGNMLYLVAGTAALLLLYRMEKGASKPFPVLVGFLRRNGNTESWVLLLYFNMRRIWYNTSSTHFLHIPMHTQDAPESSLAIVAPKDSTRSSPLHCASKLQSWHNIESIEHCCDAALPWSIAEYRSSELRSTIRK